MDNWKENTELGTGKYSADFQKRKTLTSKL